jgi:Ca-activated chloride channel family protein
VMSSMQTLAQSDGTVSGRFSTLRHREAIAKKTFCGDVFPTEWFNMTEDVSKNKEVLTQFSAGVGKLDQHLCDATAIYDALRATYGEALIERKKGGRSVSVVLLSDGESNTGARLAEFLAYVKQQGELKVPVYVILYGEINASEMEQVASATGGKTFDARKMSLKQVMKAIRSYQ